MVQLFFWEVAYWTFSLLLIGALNSGSLISLKRLIPKSGLDYYNLAKFSMVKSIPSKSFILFFSFGSIWDPLVDFPATYFFF